MYSEHKQNGGLPSSSAFLKAFLIHLSPKQGVEKSTKYWSPAFDKFYWLKSELTWASSSGGVHCAAFSHQSHGAPRTCCWHNIWSPQVTDDLREGITKKRLFWEIFPKCGWMGWLIPKQGPIPSKPPQITPKSPFLTQISPFVFPNLTKTLGWVGKQIWENSPQKKFFLFECGL